MKLLFGKHVYFNLVYVNHVFFHQAVSILIYLLLLFSDQTVFVPSTVELRTKDVHTNRHLLASAGLTYPICKPLMLKYHITRINIVSRIVPCNIFSMYFIFSVCKPSLADGTDSSHEVSDS